MLTKPWDTLKCVKTGKGRGMGSENGRTGDNRNSQNPTPCPPPLFRPIFQGSAVEIQVDVGWKTGHLVDVISHTDSPRFSHFSDQSATEDALGRTPLVFVCVCACAWLGGWGWGHREGLEGWVGRRELDPRLNVRTRSCCDYKACKIDVGCKCLCRPLPPPTCSV